MATARSYRAALLGAYVLLALAAVRPAAAVDRYVDVSATGANNGTTWANACTDLQPALRAAVRGDTVHVAAGVYKPTVTGGDTNATFRLYSGVTLLGGYPSGGGPRDPAANVTTLSGDISGGATWTDDDGYVWKRNSMRVVEASNTDSTAVLDGFTVRDGSAADWHGAGLFAGQASPTVRNVIFSHNRAWFGAAIYAYGGQLSLTSVTFANNEAVWGDGGGIYSENANDLLNDVRFSGNTAADGGNGGGAALAGATMTDVTFSDNVASAAGGGLYCYGSGRKTLTNVTFRGNRANGSGGGLRSQQAAVEMTNFTFEANQAGGPGGGISSGGNSLTLKNGTFSGNTTQEGGGGLATFGDVTVTNATFAGNSAKDDSGGARVDGTAATFLYVTFSGNTAGSQGGGALRSSSPAAVVRNSIAWGNSPNQCATNTGRLVISDSVVQGGAAGMPGVLPADATHIITADPKLGALGNHGGDTQTIDLLEGSSAIDTANSAYPANTDQRGVSRPQRAGYDIGAYEAILPQPGMSVQGNGVAISNGAMTPSPTNDTDFGSADLLIGSVSHTFTILNTGTADLNLTGNPLVALGAAPSAFALTTPPTSPVAPGGRTTFTVTFRPFTLGRSATRVSIANNDPKANPYYFEIQGLGTLPPIDNPPVLTVPADVTAEQTSAAGTLVDLGQATAVDDLDLEPIVTNDAPVVFPLGETIVTWTATDFTGHLTTATQLVTVVDTTPPTLTVPPAVTAEQTSPDGAAVDLGAATAADVCDAQPTITNDAPAVFPPGLTVVTWTATDASGNQVTGTQDVTVADTTPPTLSAPPDVTVEQATADGTAVDLGAPVAADGGDPHPTITNDAPAVFPLGLTVVTWTATDAAGNQATATQNVTVVDTTPPVLSVPPDASVAFGGDTDPGNTGQATATDICDAAPLVTYTDAVLGGTDRIDRIWTATDASGNVATGYQAIYLLRDTTPPVLTVPADVTAEQTSRAGTSVAIGEATAVDSHDPSPQVSNDAPAVFPLGVTTVTWTATDASGNQSTATQNVTVVDTTPPVLRAPADVQAEQRNRAGTAAALGQPTVADICDANPQVTNNAPAVFPLGLTTVTWTVTDASGNRASATQKVTIVDTTPPTFALDVLQRALWPANKRMVLAVTVGAVADICDAAPAVSIQVTSNEAITRSDWSVTQVGGTWQVRLCANRAPSGCGRQYVVTAKATDRSGNVATRSATVTVPHDQGK